MSGRIYRNFPEAFSEITRDVKEMGIEVDNKTYQASDAKEGYKTLEIQNYLYTVNFPRTHEIDVPNHNWVEGEWKERYDAIHHGHTVNPGTAYLHRNESEGDSITWSDHLNGEGQFDYTYGERFAANNQVQKAISMLQHDHATRQAYVAMWDPFVDIDRVGGNGRVPCSIGWHFMIRQGTVNMSYYMRSCELGTHYRNDCFLSTKLLEYVANAVMMPAGTFTHYINSLHCYKKNLEKVF